MATLVLVVALVATSPPWPRGEEASTNTNSLHPFVESADGSRIKLSALNIDPTAVVTAGLGDSADFAHQFHIAFSRTVSGACVFSGQPFNCAVSGFAGDPASWHAKMLMLHGSASSTNDHCKSDPDVVDVGSLVDYPRRHCGQNPVSVANCFDDVNYVKTSRVFLFVGTHDQVSLPGTIENVDGLLAQMISEPQRSIKVVRDQAFGHQVPLRSTPHVGGTTAAGYDGPGECLRHVYDDAAMKAGNATDANWYAFDQTEFYTATPDDKAFGFQAEGWVYVPERCQNINGQGPGSNPCKLVIRPGACKPPADHGSADVAEYANYAEANGIVVLHPCMGGPLDKSFTHAPDVAKGKMDVYGQLDPNYVQQSAPHMRVIGRMVRRVLGTAAPPAPPQPVVASASAAQQAKTKAEAAAAAKLTGTVPDVGAAIPLPSLKIDKASVMTAGCSNTADFSHQFHVAFSSIVTGSCIFSGMPYHCAVTRFANDYMVAKSKSTAAGIHCMGCDTNGTLTYDHCKNHPTNVNLDMLAAYAESPPPGHVIDDPKVHLAGARVFSFGPTHDRCYQPPAMENVANFHLRYAKNAEQVMLVEDQPFPHTLPTNDTAYYNTNGNTTGAMYDGPGECLKHIFGHGERLYPVDVADANGRKQVEASWKRVNNAEFITSNNTAQGYKEGAWLFVPPQCNAGGCKLIVLPGGCNAYIDPPPNGGSDDAFARYGMANGIVVLKPCQGGPIDRRQYPDNHENLRGMVDVYGQLSELYATQKGGQMEPTGKMIQRLLQ